MAKIFWCIVVLYVNFTNGQNTRQAVQGQLKSLQWLVGSWERTNLKAGIQANEQWNMDAAELTGLGVTLRNRDTVFIEKMRIIERENNLYYVADVKENPEPVHFRFIKITETGFTCENPEHDFPKKNRIPS